MGPRSTASRVTGRKMHGPAETPDAFTRLWCRRRDLNPRPPAYEADALPLSYCGKPSSPRRACHNRTQPRRQAALKLRAARPFIPWPPKKGALGSCAMSSPIDYPTNHPAGFDVLASKFDLPTGLLQAERRLTERALRLWVASGHREIIGFEAHDLLIGDPAGAAEVLRVAEQIERTFELRVGQMLALDPWLAPNSLGMELRAACDLAALGCRPMTFETTLYSPGHGLILARGIALPLPEDQVQLVMSWREALSRSATQRLRQELGEAFTPAAPARPIKDALPLGPQAKLETRVSNAMPR